MVVLTEWLRFLWEEHSTNTATEWHQPVGQDDTLGWQGIANWQSNTNAHMYTYCVYMYIYICVSVCVCVGNIYIYRERERQRFNLHLSMWYYCLILRLAVCVDDWTYKMLQVCAWYIHMRGQCWVVACATKKMTGPGVFRTAITIFRTGVGLKLGRLLWPNVHFIGI